MLVFDKGFAPGHGFRDLLHGHQVDIAQEEDFHFVRVGQGGEEGAELGRDAEALLPEGFLLRLQVGNADDQLLEAGIVIGVAAGWEGN